MTLQDRYTQAEGAIYLGGMHALVRVLLDQQAADRARGLNVGTFVSGYPGSPIGGLDGELLRNRKLLLERDIHFVPGLNEDLAATAVFGAQLAQTLPEKARDGVVGLWYGKAPGVDRSIDAFRHGMYRGMAENGAMIAVAGDDPAPKSSIVPNDSLALFYDLMMPTVFPADIQDLIDLGLHAFALSRATGVGAGLKLIADVADAAGTAIVGPDRVRPVIPTVEVDGVPFVPDFVPNRAGARNREQERLYHAGRLMVAAAYGRENRLNRLLGATSDARITIVAPGKTYLDLMEALRQLGVSVDRLADEGIRVMRVSMPYPLDVRDLRDAARGVEEVLIVEEKRAFIERFMKEALFDQTERPRVVGKVDERDRELVPAHGALNPDQLVPILAARLDHVLGGDRFAERAKLHAREVTARPPIEITRTGHFCSGCPHTTSLQTPDGDIVGGGIGCHTMALHMGREEFGEIVGFTQMGGEGSQWVGVAPFTDRKHFFQNLGDGTFAHSGSLAIRFAVASKVNVTYKLLFNSAVAMTGGQDILGGKTLAETVALLQAEGVAKIVVTTDDTRKYRWSRLARSVSIRPRAELLDVQRELREIEGVTVLIHDQQCAIEKRRMRRKGTLETPKEKVVINERVCEGCGDCGRKSSCLSVIPVDTEFGRKTQIHQSSCTTDLSCLKGDCPSFVTVVPKAGSSAPKRALPELPEIALETPKPLCSPDDFELHMSGVGGTGVVTVNQILGVAAASSGRSVRLLDQFGSSQKAGAVASHIKISTAPIDRAPTVANGGADAMLIFDVLGATEPANLAKADPAKTIAIVSTDRVPTGAMVVNPKLSFPKLPLFAKVIDANTIADKNLYVDAKQAAETLLGNHLATNLFVVGVAYQRGVIPLPIEAIEHAIRLNGVAVEMNLAAFQWGRIAVGAPELLAAALDDPADVPAPVPHDPALTGWADGELRRLLDVRVAELIAFQDRAYAERYVADVRRVHEREQAVGTGGVAEAVAVGLHKLLAYKDEYEIARLHLLDAERARISEQFGPGAKVYWKLHPPFLRALGMQRKLSLGPWFAPVFRILRSMRRLRGTALDVFGYAQVRRVERELIGEYRAVLDEIVERLAPDTAATAAEIAALPDMVRGYEEIKLANVAAYHERLAELRASWGDEAAGPLRVLQNAGG
ncbi:MAG: indolepyruvate ferredoxin oxidoreductase family protein [Patulibacter sp.]|nr:indolepyruvate ferredoxin oxidoreductase family protein [Patulibacter sp.]